MDLLSEFEREPGVCGRSLELRALPAPEYSDEDWERVRDVAQVLVLAAAELERGVSRAGRGRFSCRIDGRAARARHARMPRPISNLRLDYRLQHILVDEFQDTSSAQLELLRLLTAGWQRGDGRSVFCVGDPMQSIYGFRQAEVRAFLELAEDGIGDVQFDVQRLSSNFRSARDAWSIGSTPASRASCRGWMIEIAAPSPFGRASPRCSRRRGRNPSVTIRGFATRGAEAVAIADLIEARRRQHPEWRIAVLVRARAHAREIAHRAAQARHCFSRRGHRAAPGSPGGARSGHAHLRAAASGRSHGVVGRVARAMGRTHAGGLLIVARGRADRVGGHLRRRRARADERGRQSALPAVAPHPRGRVPRAEPRHVARWVERTWLGIGGPGCATDAQELEHVRAVFARLRELERRGLPDAADLVAKLCRSLCRWRRVRAASRS